MKKIFSVILVIALLSTQAFAMTADEENEAWKNEPAYGRVIKIGYNGGLCLGTFGIAQMKGFYEAEGLKNRNCSFSRFAGRQRRHRKN